MEYYELTLKLRIPRPRRSWFRYRVRSLLLVMLLIAVGATAWNLYFAGARQRLLLRLEQSKAERDAALQQWKSAMSRIREGGDAANQEQEARARYFEHMAEIKDALQQLEAKSG